MASFRAEEFLLNLEGCFERGREFRFEEAAGALYMRRSLICDANGSFIRAVLVRI